MIRITDRFFTPRSEDDVIEFEEETGFYRIRTPGLKTAWYSDAACCTLHRVGAPAVVYDDGDASWYYNGKRHRDDGPAIDWPLSHAQLEGRAIWWKHGKAYEPTAHDIIIWKSNQLREKQNAQSESKNSTDD